MKLSKKTKQRLINRYGPWALITGASSGIGKALAQKLAASGFNLLLVARNGIELLHIKSNLELQFDVHVEVLATDCSLKEGIDKVLASSKELNIGLLVIAAGFGTSGLFLESSLEEELNMLHLNCESVFALTHHFTQKFANRGSGGIILLSSIVGFQGTPYASHYAATKAYVQSLAEGLYHELKSIHIDILAASPGPVQSAFAKRARMQMKNALQPSDIAVPILRALGKRSTVFPGALTKLLIFGLRTVPRWGKIRIMKQVMSGMTKHQHEKSSNHL